MQASNGAAVAASPLAADRRGSGLRAGAFALLGFTAVFVAVQAKRTAAIDLAVALQIQGRKSPAMARLMTAASWPGFPPQSRIIPPSLALILWIRRYRLEAVCQLAAWSTALLSTVLKTVTRRPRPLPPQIQVVIAPLGGTSFPSGHVLTYVGAYGFFAYLANSLVRPSWLRRAVVAPLVALVALVGPSRIYQGHHWPTDVLASYLLGLSYVLGLASIYDRLRRPAKAPGSGHGG